jgi:hypothetical protein
MSDKRNSEIAVIVIDIGKNSFVGQDRPGAIVVPGSRVQIESRLAKPAALFDRDAGQCRCPSSQSQAAGTPAKYVCPV